MNIILYLINEMKCDVGEYIEISAQCIAYSDEHIHTVVVY